MSSPFIDRNGNVVSSALRVGRKPQAQGAYYNQLKLIEGQIIRIVPKNENNDFVTYDVLIRDSDGSTGVYTGCKAVQPLFGGAQNNFLEVIPLDPGPRAEEAVERSLKRGTMVLLGFISAQATNPLILGAMPHFSDRAAETRPKENKAVVEGEFQGLNFKIEEDGSFNLTFNGPRKDSGELKNQNGPTAINIDKDGNLSVTNNNEQSIEISRTTNKLTATSGPTKVILDKAANKIQVQAENVEIGDGALQPAVVGDDWKAVMEQLIDAILALTVPTPVGPSGTPINAPQFAQVKQALVKALSKKHKVEK